MFTLWACLFFTMIIKVDSRGECGATVIETEGHISSFSPYNRGKNCYWDIMPNISVSYIKLTWKEFKVDGVMPSCKKDFVEIHSGCQSPVRLVRFCSNNLVGGLPHDIYTNDNCLKIHLHSSNKNSSKQTGFVASFQAFSTGYARVATKCKSDVDLTQKSGVIASPKWPLGYTNDDLLGYIKNCEWDIKANKLHVIQVNVMDIDFDGSKSWLGSNCYKKNRLELEGEHSVHDDENKKKGKTSSDKKYSQTICTAEDPFTWSSRYYEIEVELKGGYYQPTRQRRGFILGYVQYKDEELLATVKKLMMIALVVVGVITACCAACWIKRRCFGQRGEALTTSNQGANENILLETSTSSDEMSAENSEKAALNPKNKYFTYGDSEAMPPPYPGTSLPMEQQKPYPPPPVLNQGPYPPPPVLNQGPYSPIQQPAYPYVQQPPPYPPTQLPYPPPRQ